MTITVTDGAHSPAYYSTSFLTHLFNMGVITEFAGANHYAICYGELCAYKDKELLAIWSVELPDRPDLSPPADDSSYVGAWEKQ